MTLSATASVASVAAATCSTVMPGAVSISVARPFGNAITASSLTTRSTHRIEVSGDHREIALALADQLVDHPLGAADRHEAADHHARTVGNHRDGIGDFDGFHARTPRP